MDCPAYAELHAHSYFSFLDGVASPEDLVEAAEVAGITALALTDHHGLYGVPRFLQATKGRMLAPIVGAELTIGGPAIRTNVPDPAGEHVVVLAASPDGYRALARVIAKGHMAGGTKGSFALDWEDLEAAGRGGGWVVLTGCRKGPLARALVDGGPRAARSRLGELVERFGRDAVVVEVSDHGDPLDTARTEAFVRLAVEAGVRAACTQNVHALDAPGQRHASVAAAIRASRRLAEIDPYLPAAGAPRLRTPREQQRRFQRFPGLVETTREIAEQCRFPWQLIVPGLPRSLAPAGETDSSWLRRLTFERARARYGDPASERVPGAYRQLAYELDIIEALGFPGYFLVVADLVDFCRREGIYCQGRGSAANSAVCYALGITNADPVALGLLFERFLSPERDGPPDIDVDIESGRREEVLQYVYQRYGREHAAQVASVITYRARSAVRDAARAYGVPTAEIDRWSRSLEHRSSLARALAATDHRGRPVATVPEAIADAALALEGTPRHLGLHVGGMVICDRPIVEVCPTEWARKEGRSVLQWDKDDCAAMGLVKFDLLGLGMLEAIHHMVDIVKEVYGEEVDIALLPQEPAVYEMLARADSVGVFQVESRAQMATLPRLRPTCFYDLVVEVALIRPGPIQGGSVHPYLRRRSGQEPVTYLHPLLERSLAKTLGVPLFQEQLMQMAMDIAGFTPSEADELRQAMSHRRSRERMHRLKERLFAGMEAHGVPDDTKEQVYEKLEAFASFGFPESHAASFAYLVYASAWFKWRYPAAFYAGLLRAQPMGFWSPQTLVRDAVRHQVGTLRPDVNAGAATATVEVREGRSWLRLGLDGVRGIGRATAAAIVKGAPYDSALALATRANLTERQLMALGQAGALASLEADRRTLIWRSGQLVEGTDGLTAIVAESPLPALAPMTPAERYQMEATALGLVVDGHPIELLRPVLDSLGVRRASELGTLADGARVRVAGIVTHRQRPGTAHGMVFLNLEDETGLINVALQPGVWVRYRREAIAGSVLVVGILQRVEGVVSVRAQRIDALPGVLALRSRDFC